MSNDKRVTISGTGSMHLTEAIKTLVMDKVEKLFKHDGHIIKMHVHLGPDAKKHGKETFTAKADVEVNGPDIHAHATTEDLYKSIDEMVDKLDRQIKSRVKEEVAKRKHPHDIDIPSDIPKTH